MATALRLAGLDEAVDTVTRRAGELDAGRTDTREDLAALGAAGLLGHGITDDSLPSMVAVLEEISVASLAVGFSAWAQRMAAEFLHRADDGLRDAHLDSLVSGRRVGVTAMAAALKQVAGLGDVPITASRRPGGLVATGPIRWASNVFDDALIVLPLREESGRSHVAVVESSAPGVKVNPAPALLGLESTASTSLHLDEVHIDDADIISTDLTAFVRGVRPVFLLLQSAFCTGSGRAALDGAEAVLGGINEVFAGEVAELRSEHHSVRTRLYDFAADPAALGQADLIRLRLQAAQVAVRASRLEATLRGGAGYAMGSAANRRFREIAFLPIQSPSEGQLRWELAQYE
ncbi:acyl-CoA dehydrogenase family protein [Mycolicibacterium thermoresistibile]